jgi:hypothetical protein
MHKDKKHMIFKATFKYSNTSFYLAYIIKILFQNLKIWSPIMTSTNAIKKSASSFWIGNLEFSNLHLLNLCMITHINMCCGIKFQIKLAIIKNKDNNLQRFMSFRVYDLELQSFWINIFRSHQLSFQLHFHTNSTLNACVFYPCSLL